MSFYDRIGDKYDLLISWSERLRREKPFFQGLFRKNRVKRVLDTACGTGMHALAFKSWGYHVVGSDSSAVMINKARENAGKSSIKFIQASFTDIDKIGGLFDAVTCLGNSLAHVNTEDELVESLCAMYQLLIPGGIVVIHGHNYDRILRSKERMLPIVSRKHQATEYVFLRFFDIVDGRVDFNIVSLVMKPKGWEIEHQKVSHLPLTRKLLGGAMRKAGFAELCVYGGFSFERYARYKSEDLILVGQKPHTIVSCPPAEPVSALDRIPICDNGEPLVDISAVVPGILTRTEPMLVRRSVAERLSRAQSMLSSDCRLKVLSSFRSLARQKELYDNYLAQLARRHPEWPMSRLRREANKFLAPPDSKHPPGHSTGGAVDVTLVGADGLELDMTSTIEKGIPGSKTFPTYSREVTPEVAKNRQKLIDAMLGAGFSNYHGEWWHWSFGDSAWALRTGHPYALYGAAEAIGL